jgi:very-long-chain ceramide synthase
MCIWIYLRHYLNLRIIISLFTEFRTVGPFELNWETEQYKCWISQIITFALLAMLQALNVFWLFFILRIAYRFVVYQTAEDDRSDNEASEEDGEAEAKEEAERMREKERKMLMNRHANGTAAPPEVLLNGAPVEVEATSKTNGRVTRSSRKAQ